MGTAFAEAVDALGIGPQDQTKREEVARLIIQLAQENKILDAATLRGKTVDAVRGSTHISLQSRRTSRPMPTGPKGEKRPADVIGNAVHVMRIATGEIEETERDPAKELHRQGGLKGGKARAQTLSSEKRREIASKAAAARWKKK